MAADPNPTVRLKLDLHAGDDAALLAVMDREGLAINRPFELLALNDAAIEDAIMQKVAEAITGEPSVWEEVLFDDGTAINDPGRALMTVRRASARPGGMSGPTYNYDVKVTFPTVSRYRPAKDNGGRRLRRGNPGGRLPATVERCVAKVGPRRAEQLGAREGLSSAIAICTAQGQRSGTLRMGTRTPTAKGVREERNARRRKGFTEAEREVARLAEMARKDNMHHNNSRRARKSNGAMVRYQVWERRAGSRAARPWRLAISDTTSNDVTRHLHDLVDRRPMVEMVAIEGVASNGFARADLPEGRVLARVRTDAHGVVPMQSPQTKRVGGTLRFVSRYSPREWQELAAQSDTPLAVSDFASGWVELGMDLPEASLFLARGISNPREALRLRGSVGKTRTKTR